jgi:hypothetical protein
VREVNTGAETVVAVASGDEGVPVASTADFERGGILSERRGLLGDIESVREKVTSSLRF